MTTPKMHASTDIGIMLKYHNACGLQQANALKNTIIQENIRFVDKIAAAIATSCVCCSIHSLPCMLQKQVEHGGAATHHTHRRKLQLGESDGTTIISIDMLTKDTNIPRLNNNNMSTQHITHFIFLLRLPTVGSTSTSATKKSRCSSDTSTPMAISRRGNNVC